MELGRPAAYLPGVTDWIAVLAEVRVWIVGAFTVLLAVVLSGHAILHKRDSRAAVAWVGLIWLAPVLGGVLYVLFGVNRIRRRATQMRVSTPRLSGGFAALAQAETVLEVLPQRDAHLASLGRLLDNITRRPLTSGNRLVALEGGDTAYADMLEAIRQAKRSVALATYIFDDDAVGRQFMTALADAVTRGVAVRVLIDAVGARYSWPPADRTLRRLGVPTARFLPTVKPWRAPFLNLRNHRKLLVTDGAIGFTGGMNIRKGHALSLGPRRPVRDVHFRLEGPVVRHLTEVFAEDWAFTTRELLDGPDWFPSLAPAGSVAARGISDGPDEDFDKLYWTVDGAIATARRRIRILTPYFLPDQPLIRSLSVAALRGVDIQILLPAANNQPLVAWAAQAQLWQLLRNDIAIRMSPGVFDHSKLMVVDDAWTLVGSANWDPRSLRLNFEFNVEAYDPAFGAEMGAWFANRWDVARPVTRAELDGRSLAVRLRDGIARLAAPYL